MENMNAASSAPSYDDFEPFCKWHKEEVCDIIDVHLPAGFAKEHLRVQICKKNNLLTIFGECPLDRSKRSRFHKEIKLSDNINTNQIRAKFTGGILSVAMPKKVPSVAAHETVQPELVCKNNWRSSTAIMRRKKVVAVIVVVIAAFVAFGVYIATKCKLLSHLN